MNFCAVYVLIEETWLEEENRAERVDFFNAFTAL